MSELEQKGQTDVNAGAMRRRSIAIALLLLAMVVIFYATTIIRLGGGVANKLM